MGCGEERGIESEEFGDGDSEDGANDLAEEGAAGLGEGGGERYEC